MKGCATRQGRAGDDGSDRPPAPVHRRTGMQAAMAGIAPTRLPVRLSGLIVLLLFLLPAVSAAGPLWTVPASAGEDLSTVVISRDGSTIVAGGDQLIALTFGGTKLWTGWSGTLLDISSNGRYIVTSQGPTVRLFSREGTMLWDQSLGTTVTALSMAPDGSLIAAAGGSAVQSWYNSGTGLGRNTTVAVRDIRISPAKDQIIVTTAKALRSFNLSYVPNWYDDGICPGMVAVSGDGTGIVVPNGNHVMLYHGGGILLWDKAFSGGNIISLAYSRDGSTILAGRDDGTVLVLDRNGDQLFSAKAGYWATSVATSDNGSIIATGSIDNYVRIFDRQGTQLLEYKTKNPVKYRSVAVSGDGTMVMAVDSTEVYAFSRAQFSGEAVPVASGSTSAAPAGNVTPAAAVTAAGSPSQLPVPTTTAAPPTTPAAGIPWVPVMAALACIIAVRIQ